MIDQSSLQILTVGRRKTATSQIYLTKGSGKIIINNKPIPSYFSLNSSHISKIETPLDLLGLKEEYNLKIEVSGGGFSSQATAIQLGIARALAELDPDYRKPLKLEGLLRSDARKKERKKYGLRKARKAPQYSKR